MVYKRNKNSARQKIDESGLPLEKFNFSDGKTTLHFLFFNQMIAGIRGVDREQTLSRFSHLVVQH